MDQYKQASVLKLRFKSSAGLISVEQLWSLTQPQLSSIIKEIKKDLKDNDNDDDLSFLSSTKKVDVENQLRFDIAKDVYLTKKQQMEELKTSTEKKEHDQKILSIIARKKESDLESKSIEELEKLLSK